MVIEKPKWHEYINPTKIIFPIFWFPILMPSFVALLSIVVEVPKGSDRNISFLVMKYLIIGYLSTDLWALTTLLMEAAKQKLHGLFIWSLGLGQILTIFLHIFCYLWVCRLTDCDSLLFVPSIIFAVSTVFVLMTRYWFFAQIEAPQLIELIHKT